MMVYDVCSSLRDGPLFYFIFFKGEGEVGHFFWARFFCDLQDEQYFFLRFFLFVFPCGSPYMIFLAVFVSAREFFGNCPTPSIC